MSVRELVDRIVPSDLGRRVAARTTVEPVKAAVAEIRRRLEAIQMYQGTEAVIIRMILAGRRAID
jgi:hypothetical protein